MGRGKADGDRNKEFFLGGEINPPGHGGILRYVPFPDCGITKGCFSKVNPEILAASQKKELSEHFNEY